MFRPLDGPSAQDTLTVTAGAVVEAKVGASALSGRQVITIKADEKIYVYFGDDQVGVPSVATVQADGLELEKKQLVTFEAAQSQPVYLLALSSTASVKLIERA